MTISEYQKWAAGMRNGVYKTDKGALVAALGLAGEAGEVCNDIKKLTYGRFTEEQTKEKVREELGDTAWYLAAVASAFDLDLHEILQHNHDKLEKRLAEKHPNYTTGVFRSDAKGHPQYE